MGLLGLDGSESPLRGLRVLDASRMLPGAVLARMLIDLGADLVKIEDPHGGDPMRSSPPLVDGIGAGFRHFLAGAESVALDLRSEDGAEALRKLARHADVFVESFRPGTLERWDLGRARLSAANPSLIVCSLSSFGATGPDRDRVGHDLNFMADSGLLDLLGVASVPGAQIADVTGGLLACSAILAALVRRARTGSGAAIDQPLSRATAPFLAFAMAEARAGGRGVTDSILAGRCPAYRTYRCRDDRPITLAALEPKFWVAFVDAIGLAELAGVGLDTGPDGERAAIRVEARLGDESSDHWVELGARLQLPIAPVRTIEEAIESGAHDADEPPRPAPRLGEQTRAVLDRHGVSAEAIERLTRGG